MFGRAITCAILAPSGPKKARIIALLQKDSRSQSSLFGDLLNKIFKAELLRDSDVKEFEESLKPH
jgi:COP9 signalosome complex subunit 4